MDIIFHLLGLLIKGLLDTTDRDKASPRRSRPDIQIPAQRSQTRAPALAPRTRVAAQNPADGDEARRSVLTLLALIVLVIIVAVWIMYMQGRLSGG